MSKGCKLGSSFVEALHWLPQPDVSTVQDAQQEAAGQLLRVLHTAMREADPVCGSARLPETVLAGLVQRYAPQDLAAALRLLVRRGTLWEPQSSRPLHPRADWRPLLQVGPGWV